MSTQSAEMNYADAGIHDRSLAHLEGQHLENVNNYTYKWGHYRPENAFNFYLG
jgi:hypothetical protein